MKITTGPSQFRTEFVLQHNGLKCSEVQATLDAMQGLTGYSYGLIPFSKDITGLDTIPRADYPMVALGSTKLVQMHHEGLLPDNWLVFHDMTTFSQDYYGPLLGSELLNHKSTFMSLESAMNLGAFDEMMFIKPADDLKMFAGGLMCEGDSVASMLSNMQHQELDMEATVLLAPYQELYREYRVFVVDGVAVGFTQYKDENQNIKAATVSQTTRDQLYFNTKRIDKHFRPADVYTIDYAEVGPTKKLKVVEYNCFNCSGMYKADRNAVLKYLATYIDSLELHFEY
jgi:hypothetical protein